MRSCLALLESLGGCYSFVRSQINRSWRMGSVAGDGPWLSFGGSKRILFLLSPLLCYAGVYQHLTSLMMNCLLEMRINLDDGAQKER